MARRVLDIFLSSTAVDLAEHRAALHARLVSKGLFHCIRQEDFGAQNAGAVEFCREKVKSSDLFVGLVGVRRGWEPDGDSTQRSITEMEHEWAREAGARRYIWVSPDDFDPKGREPDAPYARQQDFRKKVMAGGERIVSQKDFASPESLASEIVEHLLNQIITSDLITLLRDDLARLPGSGSVSVEDQRPAIAAAVGQLTEDNDIDPLELAKDPKGLDPKALEQKLRARAERLEAEGRPKVDAGEADLKRSAEYWRHIGALAFLHDTEGALKAYEKATALDPDDAEGWLKLGELEFRRGELDAADTAFQQVMRVGVEQGNQRLEALACLRLGWIPWTKCVLDAAEKLFKKSLRLSELVYWPEGIARASGNLGLIYHTRGDLDRAEEMHRIAIGVDEALSRTEGLAASYGNLGLIFRARGDLDRAVEMHTKALALDEALGRKEGIATDYGNLGIVYCARGEFDRAEEMHTKALALEVALGRKEGIATAYGNLGIIYDMCGDLDRAEEMYLKSLRLNEVLGKQEGMASQYGNLGIIYRQRGDLDRAEETYLMALSLNETIGSKTGMAKNLHNLGLLDALRDNIAAACAHWTRARDLYREIGAPTAADLERWMREAGCEE